jgi:cellulose synthase/poly-beta-1,6-N-acetylglucosamine synthase-like glycosyltransferase
MDYAQYLAQISFRFLQAAAPLGRDGRFLVAREGREPARLLDLPGSVVDIPNTKLPPGEQQREKALRSLCAMPRMSTLAVSSLINRGVAQMDPGHAFVNVGVWKGFTFLSAITGNPDKTCIGVDNFSEFGAFEPRDAFISRFEPIQSPAHRFYEMDYREYFANVHEERIGFYFYDGNHAYSEQLRGLELAEPFFADDCIVLVDDTNWEEPRLATADFINKSEYEYRLLLNETTTANAHPTWWNGVIVLQRTSQAGRRASASIRATPPPRGWSTSALELEFPGDRSDGTAPPVSLVVYNDKEDEECLTSAIDACLNQTWPNVEVLVADDSEGSTVAGLGDRYGTRIRTVGRSAPDRSALAGAVDMSQGAFLGVVDSGDPPPTRTAVQIGLALHEQFRRFMPFPPVLDKWMEEALLANEEIQSVVPPDETVILINEDLWRQEVLPRRVLPFLERDGKPWGHPPDDATAIVELRRMSRSGAGFIAFAWPAFWWLDFYSGFHHFLRSQCGCLLENERLVVFELKSLAEAEDQTVVEKREAESPRYYASLADWADSCVDASGAALYRKVFPDEMIVSPEPKGIQKDADTFRSLREWHVPGPAVAVIPDGYLCRSGEWVHSAVLTSERKLIWDVSNIMDAPAGVGGDHWFLDETDLPPPTHLPGTVGVLTIHPHHTDNYCHWMFEVLPRIHLFRNTGISIDTFATDTRRASFQHETLAKLGMDEAAFVELDYRFHISAPKLAICLSPGPLVGPSWICSYLRSQFLGDVSPHAKERLYISRGSAIRGRSIVNEDEVKDMLSEFKFREFVADRASVAEQAEAFASAEVIAGPHGGAFANLAFCRPETKVIEFFAPSFVIPWFYFLSSQCNLDYHYLIGSGERPSSFAGWPYHLRSPDPIEVDVDELVRTLRKAGL